MARTRKKYDKEFKLMAVELSLKRTDQSSLAKELKITPDLLYRWRKELATKEGKSFPGNGKVIKTDVEIEMDLLRKKLKDAELENEILKKAVGIFSRSDGRNFNS
jgi:transposase